jgi:hypothetical protein
MNKRTLVVAMALAASYGHALAAETRGARETFESRWQGAWVVTTAPTASECNGIYSDNWVSGSTVRGRGRQRIEAGTPARVDFVLVTPSRVTLSLTLSERLYVTSPRRDYVLADTARCQVDLKVTVPPGLAAEGDVLALEALLEPVVERHASEIQAIVASGFLPLEGPDFAQARQEAIAAHREWKTAESSAAIAARLQEWNARNARISSQISDDPDYMAGFVRGVEAGRAAPAMECADLARATPAPYWPTAANAALAAKGKSQKAWARGYQDGARLAQGLEAVRALQACAVPATAPKAARAVKPAAAASAGKAAISAAGATTGKHAATPGTSADGAVAQ